MRLIVATLSLISMSACAQAQRSTMSNPEMLSGEDPGAISASLPRGHVVPSIDVQTSAPVASNFAPHEDATARCRTIADALRREMASQPHADAEDASFIVQASRADFRQWMQDPLRDIDWQDVYLNPNDTRQLAHNDAIANYLDTHPAAPGQPLGTVPSIVRDLAQDPQWRFGLSYYLHRSVSSQPLAISYCLLATDAGDGRVTDVWLKSAPPLAILEHFSPDMFTALVAITLGGSPLTGQPPVSN
jgi:hypothetical protein